MCVGPAVTRGRYIMVAPGKPVLDKLDILEGEVHYLNICDTFFRCPNLLSEKDN